MFRKIHMHAGAHRTGTSSFQQCLAINRSRLEAAGVSVAYPGRDDVEGGDLGLRLPKPREGRDRQAHYTAKVAGEIERHVQPDTDAVILSEENLPGRMIHFQAGRFYPAAEARFEALRAGLGDAEVARVLIVIRRYDDLFLSAFRKRAEDQVSEPFEAVRDAMAEIDRGWPELAAIILDTLRPTSFVIVPYRLRGTSRTLLHRLLPSAADLDLAEPQDSLNVSATDAALIELQARYATGEKLDRPEWQAIVEEHEQDTEARGFAEFTASQTRGLRRRFRRDLERLAEMSGVDLVT